MMPNDSQILVDSDAFVGLLLNNDVHHRRVEDLFERLYASNVSLSTTSYVIDETATVLSHRVGQDIARYFLEEVIDGGSFPTININESHREKAIDIFKQQDSRGTSMTDCVNVAVMQELRLSTIFSFDKFYSKRFSFELVGEVYS